MGAAFSAAWQSSQPWDASIWYHEYVVEGIPEVPPTPGYRLKLARARTHIAQLDQEIAAFWSRKPFAIQVENDFDTGGWQYFLKIKENVPEEWSGHIGDAIHNIHSALDLLMCSAVQEHSPTLTDLRHVYFPVRETRKKFEDVIDRCTGGASDRARRLLKLLRPYQGGNDALWQLHQLANLEKHQSIIPVGSSFQSVDLAGFFSRSMRMLAERVGDPLEEPLEVPPMYFAPGNRLYPLKTGSLLFSDNPGAGPTSPPANLNFAFEISFAHGQILDGVPVIEALRRMCDLVERICSLFERQVLRAERP